MSENGRKAKVDVSRPIGESDSELKGNETAGIVLSNVSAASTIYGMDKFSTPGGHGFAAERANHLVDKLTGKDAALVGDDNALNGADRIVNGIEIQSKYWDTGQKCISDCFENGTFKYMSRDGSPMMIEVPSDKYDVAVQAMKDRIRNGEIPGVTNPEQAKEIVKKGHFTYEQAKNIAKSGTVESLAYDATNGMIIAGSAMGITATLTFASSVWKGEDIKIALKNATCSGLKVGGLSFVTNVLSSQLARTGVNSALRGSTDYIVKAMGPRVSAHIANAFRSGKNIYGAAAMKSVSKMLCGNMITAIVSVAVFSSVDFVDIFRGRISARQLFKNLANSTASMAGGTTGWIGGVAAGAALGSAVPVVGTAFGGLVGGLVGAITGGTIAGKASSALIGSFIGDDADEMIWIIEEVFAELGADYLLDQHEAEAVVYSLQRDLTEGTLKDMFASSNRERYADGLIRRHAERVVSERQHVEIPDDETVLESIREVLEQLIDGDLVANPL